MLSNVADAITHWARLKPNIGAADFAALAERSGVTQLALTPFHVMALMGDVRKPGLVLPGVRELVVSTANCPHALRQDIRARLTPASSFPTGRMRSMFSRSPTENCRTGFPIASDAAYRA